MDLPRFPFPLSPPPVHDVLYRESGRVLIRIPIVFFMTPVFRSLVNNIGALAAYTTRLADNLSLAVAVLVVLFWNFFANRHWTYNDIE